MNAKQYLKQLRRLETRINANSNELERLRALATSSTAALSKGKGKTSGSADIIGNTVARIIDLENLINLQNNGLIKLRADIKKRIDNVPDDTLQTILQLRYSNFKGWEQIADEMNYSVRQTTRLHGDALKLFGELNKDVLECPIDNAI